MQLKSMYCLTDSAFFSERTRMNQCPYEQAPSVNKFKHFGRMTCGKRLTENAAIPTQTHLQKKPVNIYFIPNVNKSFHLGLNFC